MKRTRSGHRGFTLIELIIVVAVIGVLAAIAIPQLSAYRLRAYNSNASSDVTSLRTELEAYFAENLCYP